MDKFLSKSKKIYDKDEGMDNNKQKVLTFEQIGLCRRRYNFLISANLDFRLWQKLNRKKRTTADG